MNDTSDIVSSNGDGILLLLKDEFGINSQSSGSEFSQAMSRLISKNLSEQDRDDCMILLNGVECILEKQSQYSNISVEIIVALSRKTGHSPKRIISSITKNSDKLKVPAISWVNRNLRVADVVANHPMLSNIASVEKIDTIRRLDNEQIEKIASTGTLIDVEGIEREVNKTPTPQLRKVVNDLIKMDKDDTEDFTDLAVDESDSDEVSDLDAPIKFVRELRLLSENTARIIPNNHPKTDEMLDILERLRADIDLLNAHLTLDAQGIGLSSKKDPVESATPN